MRNLMTQATCEDQSAGKQETCRHCQQPIRRCTRTKSGGFIHASGDCKGWVHAIDGWHSCVREGPKWIFAEPTPKVA